MRGSGLGREARRRPELDLTLGPLEAAARGVDIPRDAGAPQLELIEPADPAFPPTPREDARGHG
jgi:hypothetical protein